MFSMLLAILDAIALWTKVGDYESVNSPLPRWRPYWLPRRLPIEGASLDECDCVAFSK
jgi:hypothetical protein